MRRKLPVCWILQFLILSVAGVASLFFPERMLEFYRGQRAPRAVEQPKEALYSWVLRLDSIPPPDDLVREFFISKPSDVTHTSKEVRTPSGLSLREKLDAAESTKAVNNPWKAVRDWILSATPKPKTSAEAKAIKDWFNATDEIPKPKRELRDWIEKYTSEQQKPKPPHRELRLMILEARQSLPISWRLAADEVRLSAACILAAAFFTLFGLLSPSIRRPLARIFVLIFLVWTFAMLQSSLAPAGWTLFHALLIGGLILALAMAVTAVRAMPRLSTGWVLCIVLAAWWTAIMVRATFATREAPGKWGMLFSTAIVAIMGIMNAYYWLIGKSEDPPQDDAGIAQRRPPQLWTLWLVQFVILMGDGILALVWPGEAAEVFTNASHDYLTEDIVDDSVRMLGAWLIALALFSFFALGVARDWIWQGIGWIFCAVFALLAFSTVQNALSGEYSGWQFAYGLQGLVFIPFTVVLLVQKDAWSTENVEKDRKYWSVADLLVAPALMWAPLFLGRRALYRSGVGARGRFRVLPFSFRGTGEGVPRSDFFGPDFEPEKEHPVEVRFANRMQEDDAGLDIRGCAFRISTRAGGRFDLMLATGVYAPARCLLDFRNLLPRRSLRRRIVKDRVLREGLAAGMRRAPASFAGLRYYHQLVLEWLTRGGDHYLVRFRLVPTHKSATGDGDDGLPDAEDLQHLWQQERRPGETRSSDYLRREFHDRVASGQPVVFQLEAQFHLPQRGDSLDWYDASLEWDLRAHLWTPLAELILDEPLSAEESEELCIDPTNLPLSLLVPKPANATAIRDPRSLAAAQFRVAGALGALRRWRYRPPTSSPSAAPSAPLRPDPSVSTTKTLS